MAPSWVQDLVPSSPQAADLLSQERAKSSIDVERLSNFLFTQEVLQRKERVLQVLQNDKTFDKSGNYFDGRVERYKTALTRSKRLRNLTLKHGWSPEDYAAAMDLIGEPVSYALHTSMYIVSLIPLPPSYSILPCAYTTSSPPFASKGHQNSMRSFSEMPRHFETLVVMRKPS